MVTPELIKLSALFSLSVNGKSINFKGGGEFRF